MIVLERSEVLDLKIQDRKVALINGVKRHIHIICTEQETEEHQWKKSLVGGIYQHQIRTMIIQLYLQHMMNKHVCNK